ncbi:phytoene desaturase [Myxococcota bacterium]|nr:phytoene desaturase [Myxococcota bacterium]MBU1382329.1 phytoene desaturase [Myxococcota bacterium]MBU1498439.1 phytoene desaturase [Myxococcota bacterium]
MKKKSVAVIGAGPGGLSAAMILASKGYDVNVYEKEAIVGGRNGYFQLGKYRFDIGPTFLMMRNVLDEIFEITGRNSEDYMEFTELDPMYRLAFGNGKTFFPTRNKESMKQQLESLWPGSWDGYERYMKREAKKYEKLIPCLQKPYGTIRETLNPNLFLATPYLDGHINLFKYLGKYFKHDDLKISFTFQAKYLGMSPWECPATFSIISYLEHGFGIWHVKGGLNQMSQQMAKVLEEEGGKVHLNTQVKEIIVENGAAKGLILSDGSEIRSDYVVINADFAHAMNNLIAPEHKRKYTPSHLSNMKYSCSTWMMYLGVDKLYDVPHHNIIFSPDYKKNVDEITKSMTISPEPSIYIQNAAITDPTLAPKGHSTIYILVPAPNNKSGINWADYESDFREKILDIAEQRGGLPDLRRHIVTEKLFTPNDWEDQMAVYRGATFNLAHNIGQMLYFRPHNKFEEFENCYLVGGGTHPGSGIPTILESGKLSASMILKRDFT